MSNPGLWVIDPETGQDIFVYYHELEEDVKTTIIKPIGGFIFPAEAFLAAKLAAAPFYVKDWLPKRGKSLLYAPPKSGKSYLCLQVARCIGCGDPFLGLPTTPGRVLYIQFELGEEVLQARLAQTGKTYDNVFVGTTFSMKLDTEPGQKQLRAAMEAVLPNVLILDPWYKAMLGDENEGVDARKILDFLDGVIEAYNCSILIIHHAGKDMSKRGRGSSVLEDWVDSYIQMQATNKPGEPLKIKIRPIFLRHAIVPPDPIEAVLAADFEFEQVGAGLTIKEQVLRAVMGAKCPVKPAQLFAEHIGSNTSVYEALKTLVKEGKLKKISWGEYAPIGEET